MGSAGASGFLGLDLDLEEVVLDVCALALDVEVPSNNSSEVGLSSRIPREFMKYG